MFSFLIWFLSIQSENLKHKKETMNQVTINYCKLELARGEVKSVIECLLEHTIHNDILHGEVILLSNRLQRLKTRQLSGMITDNEAETQLTKIAKSVIEIVIKYPDQTQRNT